MSCSGILVFWFRLLAVGALFAARCVIVLWSGWYLNVSFPWGSQAGGASSWPLVPASLLSGGHLLVPIYAVSVEPGVGIRVGETLEGQWHDLIPEPPGD